MTPPAGFREREQKIDPKGTPVTVINRSTTRQQDGASPGGVAGAVANGPRELRPTTAGKGSHQEEDNSLEQTTSLVGGRLKETDTAGHAPKRVTASVKIPASYFESVWRTRQGTAATETKKPPQTELDQIRTQEITKIRDAVLLLLPKPEGEADPTNLVYVVEFTDIPPEPVAEPGMPEKMTNWFTEHWTSLGLIVLAMVSLMMLRSMVRASPAVEEPLGTPVAATAGHAAPRSPKKEESAAERRLKKLSGNGPTLRDELSELVVEDPEAAANILRNWIGNARLSHDHTIASRRNPQAVGHALA